MSMTKLFCGDNVEVMRREIPDNSIQLTVTSPPYDNLRKYNGFTWDFPAVARELYRVTKPGGVVVWVVADATVNGSETCTSFRQALYFKECGFNVHDTMMWIKDGGGAIGSSLSYTNNHEYMFVFSNGRPAVFNPIKDRRNAEAGKYKLGGVRNREKSIERTPHLVAEFSKRNNWWAVPSAKSYGGHPAVYPEQIPRDHIISWSNPGDTVLDPFLGSGTTGKMAAQLGRFFIGCDISPEYVEIARSRIGGCNDDPGSASSVAA